MNVKFWMASAIIGLSILSSLAVYRHLTKASVVPQKGNQLSYQKSSDDLLLKDHLIKCIDKILVEVLSDEKNKWQSPNRDVENEKQVKIFKEKAIHCVELLNSNTLDGSVSELSDDERNKRNKMMHGYSIIRSPQLNKGLSFTIEERKSFGIYGLIPPRVRTQDQEVKTCYWNFKRYEMKEEDDDDKDKKAKEVIDDEDEEAKEDKKAQINLSKYIYLMEILERDERLFYRFLSEHIEEAMPIVYTPTVGLACKMYGHIFSRPQGVFITINDDTNDMENILKSWPEKDVKAIVVTDGQRILGLGDLGANGIGIPIGKLALYTALGGVVPHHCLPITLDVGTNNENLLADENYIGLKRKRQEGVLYDQFIDKFMKAVVKTYGKNVLIQFEDFGNANAFKLLKKYRDDYCTFNDDIQGTASVVLAGLLAALRINEVHGRLGDHTILFFGAGEASLGIASLFVKEMVKKQLSEEQARSKIWFVDSKGLIVESRTNLTEEKKVFAQKHEPMKGLADIIDEIKPSVLIGAATIKGSFDENVIRKMANINRRPVIFALSNPTSQAECTALEAYTYSDGRAIFATGSPFEPVNINNKVYYTGQANNAYIFPGVALGIISVGVKPVTDEVFLDAAEVLSNLVTKDDLAQGLLYPPLKNIKEWSVQIATRIAEEAYQDGLASYPKPKDIEAFIRSKLYNYNY